MAVLRIRDKQTGKWIELPAIKGEKGDKGDTPQKGTDYFTPAEQEAMILSVLERLPKAEDMTV